MDEVLVGQDQHWENQALGDDLVGEGKQPGVQQDEVAYLRLQGLGEQVVGHQHCRTAVAVPHQDHLLIL